MSGISDEYLKHDSLYWLSTHAEHLSTIDTPDPQARAFYEIMSGALVWPDETKSDTPIYAIWSLRGLWAYRTHLMLDELEPDNDDCARLHEYWPKCVALFPNWIGFLPDRRKRTPELLAEYRRGDVSLRWCLRNAEREAGREK